MTRKIVSLLLALMLCLSLTIAVSAASGERFLYDEADLLSRDEEGKLAQRLEQVSRDTGAQLVIVTLPSVEGGDVTAYTDYLYDSMGFGYGQYRDGVLLLVSMSPRRYEILSNGYAADAIGSWEISSLCGIMDLYLPDGSYYTAFYYFINECEDYLDYYQNGSPFRVGRSLVISLVIGLGVGLIVAFVLKGQLKTVRSQYRAHDYVRAGSMKVNIQRDIFLFRNVTRTRRERDNDSGPSRSSRSSGGPSRSRGGGSF